LKLYRLAVLISGGGSNLQSIIDSCDSGELKGLAAVAVVVSNKPDAYGLERAKKHGIPALFLNPKEHVSNKAFCKSISGKLVEYKVDLVCLAGYMNFIDSCLLKSFKGKVINIHPALLPKFGGKGMYGHHVHEAVVAAGEIESGATVHFVDEVYDHGKIILKKKVKVLKKDTCDTLSKRVLEAEHILYPLAIKKVIKNKAISKSQSRISKK